MKSLAGIANNPVSALPAYGRPCFLEVKLPLAVEEICVLRVVDLVASPEVRVTEEDIAARIEFVGQEDIQFVAQIPAAVLCRRGTDRGNWGGRVGLKVMVPE